MTVVLKDTFNNSTKFDKLAKVFVGTVFEYILPSFALHEALLKVHKKIHYCIQCYIFVIVVLKDTLNYSTKIGKVFDKFVEPDFEYAYQFLGCFKN